MVLFALWLITSNYATEIARYPNQMACAQVLQSMLHGLNSPPRAILADGMCVPVLVMPPRVTITPRQERPGPSAES